MIACVVSGAAATANVRETLAAGAKTELPGWLASMVQLPTATSVSVVPLTVQMLVVVYAKLTARPELAVAASAGGAVPSVWLPGEVKVMVCAINGAAAIVKTRDTVAAAA